MNISVSVKDAVFAGRCNSCQENHGRDVIEVKLRTTTFRLCHPCAQALFDLFAGIDGVAPEMQRMRSALVDIANMDYRGNKHPSADLARKALK